MTVTNPRRYRRRQLIVNRALQFPFVRVMVLSVCLMAAASLTAVSLAIRVTLSTFELSQDAVTVSLFNTASWMIVLELLLVTPVVVWLGILITHKVAGPLVRIRTALAQLAAGDFNVQIRLRQGDELADVADLINYLATSLRSRRS